ncbi:hypothetical protein ACFW08_20050 [Streptomyces sp. NPDC058960]|uniref:hypothetical protein n=1 Tax=Streptomyces sp. NPDC058960 TaxID=3346679 RepID=UPI0036A633FA
MQQTASAAEWLTAAGIGVAAFVPVALPTLALRRDGNLPHVPVERAAVLAAAWLLVLAWHLDVRGATG